MITRVMVLTILMCVAGCTHLELKRSATNQLSTLTDLQYQQALDNLAMFHQNPSAIPYFATFGTGVVTVTDQTSGSLGLEWNPIKQSFTPAAQRNVQEQWSLSPVINVDNLRRMRCAYQLVVQGIGPPSESCLETLQDCYGKSVDLNSVVPRGWYYVGCKSDVPPNACYAGHHGPTYVWVMRDGREGLSRFTLTLIDLATFTTEVRKKVVKGPEEERGPGIASGKEKEAVIEEYQFRDLPRPNSGFQFIPPAIR